MRQGNASIDVRVTVLLIGVLAAIALSNTGASVAASPAETGSGITFVGPTVRELPTELEFLSASPHLTAGFTCYTGIYPPPAERCQAYLVAYEGPDPNGLYHFRFNLPTAAPGVVRIDAQTPNGGWLSVEFTAMNSGVMFGDARTCLMPGSNAVDQVAFELGFYSQASSTAVVFRQERKGQPVGTSKAQGSRELSGRGTKGLRTVYTAHVALPYRFCRTRRRQCSPPLLLDEGQSPTDWSKAASSRDSAGPSLFDCGLPAPRWDLEPFWLTPRR
jgi:hypothetical protein